ncbi:MAG: type II toxin-antitoxin system HicB family antitoxin [Planctomycetota bacterium]
MSDPARQYHIDLFYSAEDECWIADVPDLKYCSAHGETPEEAAREIRIAMDGWLTAWLEENDELPPATFQPKELLRAKAG